MLFQNLLQHSYIWAFQLFWSKRKKRTLFFFLLVLGMYKCRIECPPPPTCLRTAQPLCPGPWHNNARSGGLNNATKIGRARGCVWTAAPVASSSRNSGSPFDSRRAGFFRSDDPDGRTPKDSIRSRSFGVRTTMTR